MKEEELKKKHHHAALFMQSIHIAHPKDEAKNHEKKIENVFTISQMASRFTLRLCTNTSMYGHAMQ